MYTGIDNHISLFTKRKIGFRNSFSIKDIHVLNLTLVRIVFWLWIVYLVSNIFSTKLINICQTIKLALYILVPASISLKQASRVLNHCSVVRIFFKHCIFHVIHTRDLGGVFSPPNF